LLYESLQASKTSSKTLEEPFGYANYWLSQSTIGETMKLSIPQMQTLKRLTNGPRSSISFTTSETHLSGSYHSLTHLKNLEMNGFVVEIEDMWHLTNSGRMKLIETKSENSPRHANGTTHETYVQGNWKDLVHRRGALDFLKCESRFSNYFV
jgi:hypothetical protein